MLIIFINKAKCDQTNLPFLVLKARQLQHTVYNTQVVCNKTHDITCNIPLQLLENAFRFKSVAQNEDFGKE